MGFRKAVVSGYQVVLKPDITGGYVATCPVLRGCVSQGETVDEALANIRDAIKGVVASLRSRNLPVPAHRSSLITRH